MDRLKEVRERLKDLGENEMYNKEELKELEKWFGKKIDFAYPGWVCFLDAEGKSKYKGIFSKASEDLMISLAEKRIESLKEFASKIDACKNDEDAMQICAKFMLEYAQSWRDVEVKFSEDERRKKFFASITSINIEYGKRVLESNYPCYNAIVVRYGQHLFYAGSLAMKRDGEKWIISRRTPLAGDWNAKTDSLHIKGVLKSFMHYIG